jgi:hypothetical protein
MYTLHRTLHVVRAYPFFSIRTQHWRARGGPICIHGYSVEYPKFLTKEVHIHSILHVCVIKIEKRHYTLGFHCSIRPPQRPLPVAGPKFSRPNPPAHTFFWFGSIRTAVSSTAQQPPAPRFSTQWPLATTTAARARCRHSQP